MQTRVNSQKFIVKNITDQPHLKVVDTVNSCEYNTDNNKTQEKGMDSRASAFFFLAALTTQGL